MVYDKTGKELKLNQKVKCSEPEPDGKPNKAIGIIMAIDWDENEQWYEIMVNIQNTGCIFEDWHYYEIDNKKIKEIEVIE
jgi:hypothetical protein